MIANRPIVETDPTLGRHWPWEETACLLCGRDDAELRSEAADHAPVSGPGLRFAIVQCRHCGLTYTDPRPTPETIGAFYPSGYRPHAPRGRGAIRLPSRFWSRLSGRPCPEPPWTPRLERHGPAARLRLRRRQLSAPHGGTGLARLGSSMSRRWWLSRFATSWASKSISALCRIPIYRPVPSMSSQCGNRSSTSTNRSRFCARLTSCSVPAEESWSRCRITKVTPRGGSANTGSVSICRAISPHFTRGHARPHAAGRGLSRRGGSRPRALPLAPGQRASRPSGTSCRPHLATAREQAPRANRGMGELRSWPARQPRGRGRTTGLTTSAWRLSNRAPAPRPGCCRRPGSP